MPVYLASKIEVTNTFAQLLLGQAKLTSEIAVKLRDAIPTITEQDLVQDMQSVFPMRSYDAEILKEPNVSCTYEANTHYGEAIKTRGHQRNASTKEKGKAN